MLDHLFVISLAIIVPMGIIIFIIIKNWKKKKVIGVDLASGPDITAYAIYDVDGLPVKAQQFNEDPINDTNPETLERIRQTGIREGWWSDQATVAPWEKEI